MTYCATINGISAVEAVELWDDFRRIVAYTQKKFHPLGSSGGVQGG